MKIKLSKNKLKKNILTVDMQCTDEDKYDWYTEANQFAASLVNAEICISKACGIIAALSPLKTWTDNKRIAARLCADKDTKGIHMPLFTNKAARIHSGSSDDSEILSILSGEKIQSFYLNIKYPKKSTHVTIDRHAFSIALGRELRDSDTKVTKAQYSLLKQCYLEVAAEQNISPLLLQSSTWVRWRKNKKQTA